VGAAAPVKDIDDKYTEWGHGQYSDRELEAKCDGEQKLLCADCSQRDKPL
jgi:hypothetical protein